MRLKFIEKRVITGLFGTNNEEATELIKFILSNSEDIDFTDDSGRPKRCFLPEYLVSTEYTPVGGELA